MQHHQFSSRHQKYARSNESKYAALWLTKAHHMKSLIFDINKQTSVAVGSRKQSQSKKQAQMIQICMIQLSNNVSIGFFTYFKIFKQKVIVFLNFQPCTCFIFCFLMHIYF